MENVYEVERIVKVKKMKGTLHYLVLWKNYPKEEASWLSSNQITDLPIRLFDAPKPELLTVLDSFSSFVSSIRNSLRFGLVRQQNITLEFPRHVFNFLFNVTLLFDLHADIFLINTDTFGALGPCFRIVKIQHDICNSP
uniref:Chromo domain-containing protein n=1 Tax=Amphimedon queenslandica TaxID=400682 RepID=A0A1X7VJR8_AMPQE